MPCFSHDQKEKFSFNMHNKSMRPVVCGIQSEFTRSHTHTNTHTHTHTHSSTCGRGHHARCYQYSGVQYLCQGGFYSHVTKTSNFCEQNFDGETSTTDHVAAIFSAVCRSCQPNRSTEPIPKQKQYESFTHQNI